MTEERGARWAGRAGLFAGLLLWCGSILALMRAMHANEAASALARGGDGVQRLVRERHAAAVAWALLCGALQIASGLLLAFVLRAAYRWRAAVCFTAGAAVAMALDGLWLVALLLSFRLDFDLW